MGSADFFNDEGATVLGWVASIMAKISRNVLITNFYKQIKIQYVSVKDLNLSPYSPSTFNLKTKIKFAFLISVNIVSFYFNIVVCDVRKSGTSIVSRKQDFFNNRKNNVDVTGCFIYISIINTGES